MSNHSRRKFLSQMGCATLGMTSFFSSFTNLNLLNAAAATNRPAYSLPDPDNYKALVCIYLAGGNDSFNMLVPYGDDEYGEYQATRTNMAIPKEQLLEIENNDINNANEGKTFALHPNMPHTQALFDNGQAAFVANVGTLLQPTTLIDYNNGSFLPLGVYSHLDQLTSWQTALPGIRGDIGWGGRIADILNANTNNEDISMSFSLDGNSIFLRGNEVIEYGVSPYQPNGATTINSYGDGGLFNQIKTETLDNILDHNYQNILRRAYSNTITNANNNGQIFGQALNNAPDFLVDFSSSPSQLAERMNMIAKIIGTSLNGNIDMSRQIFYVELHGFDTHGNGDTGGYNTHGELLGELDQAFSNFWQAMSELNAQDKVTTFTISEFGRTLTSNGNGTDHGWGGNALVMGGAVNGKNIYGTYPSLGLGDANTDNIDTGQGRLIPAISCDEYFAEIALWFAHNGANTLSATELTDILPNLNEFWSPTNLNSNDPANHHPLGFLNY